MSIYQQNFPCKCPSNSYFSLGCDVAEMCKTAQFVMQGHLPLGQKIRNYATERQASCIPTVSKGTNEG